MKMRSLFSGAVLGLLSLGSAAFADTLAEQSFVLEISAPAPDVEFV